MMRRSSSAEATGRRSTFIKKKGRLTSSNVSLQSPSQLHSTRPSTVGSSSLQSNQSSELLRRWMARSASATTHSGREAEPRNGRANKASILRQQTCPPSYVQPNYREIIRQRKAFAQRCKSLSASAVRCTELSDGESLHAFVTGARYNRAHHMDARSLERFGLYVPRRDATRSFVNMSGTQPPSPAIYGSNIKATRNMSDSHFLLPMTIQQAGQLRVPAESQTTNTTSESTVSLEQEINIVFGPSRGSSSTSETESESSKGVPRESDEVEHTANSHVETSKENQENRTTGSNVTPIKETLKQNEKQDSASESGTNLTHLDEKHLKEDEKEVLEDKESATQGSHLLQIERDHGAERVQESEGDFISLEAMKLTADILQGCQQSSSSFSSSDTAHSVSSQGEIHHSDTNSAKDTERNEPGSHRVLDDVPSVVLTTMTETDKPCLDIDGVSAAVAEGSVSNHDLTSKSSTIFVDMSSLMPVQEQQTADCADTDDRGSTSADS